MDEGKLTIEVPYLGNRVQLQIHTEDDVPQLLELHRSLTDRHLLKKVGAYLCCTRLHAHATARMRKPPTRSGVLGRGVHRLPIFSMPLFYRLVGIYLCAPCLYTSGHVRAGSASEKTRGLRMFMPRTPAFGVGVEGGSREAVEDC